MTDADPRCQKCGHPRSNHPYRHMFVGPSKPDTVGTRAATPMRCAECDCEKGGADCNWIATPTPAMCCLGLTPEQCANTPSSQCDGLRPAVNPLDDPRVLALVKKARAVVDRWDSPLWKDLRHTGTLINELRDTISALEENK